MIDSVTIPRYFGERTNIAAPHEDVKTILRTVPYRQDVNVGAAGSICASVSDIASWIRLQLNNGNLDGKQLVDSSILEETRSPHTPIKLAPIERKLFPSRHFSAYGVGWFLSDYRGRLAVRHGGGVDGSAADSSAVCAATIAVGRSLSTSCVTDVNASCAPPIELASDEVEFYAGFGGASIEPPGKYRLGRVTIEALSGTPRIVIAPSTRLQPAGQTSFGSLCPGADHDNTMKLGQEWSEADGLPAAGVTSQPPVFARAHGVSMFEGEQTFRTIAATDADSDSLELALAQAPAYASLTVTSCRPLCPAAFLLQN